MDTLNEVREDGCIDISVYRKPTYTDKYLHFDSHQPIHHKAAVAKSLYSRAAKVSSSPLNKRLEVEHINRVLESDGYPKEFLKKQRRSVFETNPREDRSPGGDDDHDRKSLIILPYIRSVTGLVENAGTRICGYAGTSNWFNRFQKLINNSNKIIAVNTKNHSCEYPHIRIPAYPHTRVFHQTNVTERLKRVLQTHNFVVAKKPVLRLKNILTKVEDNVPTGRQTGIVYTIPSSNCDIQYIGETDRSLQTRTVNINAGKNMRPVIKENRWCQRRWNEACMIFKTKNVIVNRDCGKVLPDVYRSLIDQL